MARARKPDVCVLGGGMWGVVLAQHLAHKGARVTLWEFVAPVAESLHRTREHAHIPGFRLDESITVSNDLGESVDGASVLLFVLPSKAMAATARAIRRSGRLHRGAVAVNASKGVEPGTFATMGDIVAREIPELKGKVWTLTGPSFAREVARGVPTGLMLGGPAGAKAKELERLFDGGALAVHAWPDRVGVELGGSLKNVIAVGAGILDGLGAGANTKAALLVKGLEEMSRLIRAAGGRADTVYGLAGLGDLIATGTSSESRNRGYGEKLGKGIPPKKALAQIPTIVEGVEAAVSAIALCRRHRVKAPLIESIYRATRGAPARRVLTALGFASLLLALTTLSAPARAAPAPDPLAALLAEYAAPLDETAAAATSTGTEDGSRLARAQADLAALAAGYEVFAAPAHAENAAPSAAAKLAPELLPFFSDRDAALRTAYRTLAVFDYTWALRFPGPPCAPREKRDALLASDDGLFRDAAGGPSPWLTRLLGANAAGRGATDALDRASAATKPSPRDYALLRLQANRLTQALRSESAVGAARAGLYCERAGTYELLAAAHLVSAAPVEAARAARADGAPSVLLVAAPAEKGYAALGAGLWVETPQGRRVVTDAGLVRGRTGLVVFARPAEGARLGSPLAFTLERAADASGPAVGRLDSDPGVPAARLAATPASRNDLVSAVGHAARSGPWTVSAGLVNEAGADGLRTDAVFSADQAGAPVFNEAAEVVGLTVNAESGPAVIDSARLRDFLAGGTPPAAVGAAPDPSGTAAILTVSRPFDEAGLTAPGSATVEAGLGATTGGVNWEGGGGLGNFRPHAATMSPALGGGMGGGLPGMLIGLFGSLLVKALTAPHAPPRPYPQIPPPPVRLPPPPRVVRLDPAPAPKTKPEPEPKREPEKEKKQDEQKKKEEKPRILRLVLTATPATAKPGDTVELSAQLLFLGDYTPKDGIEVTLVSPSPDKAYFVSGGGTRVITRTDASGRANASLRFKEHTEDRAHNAQDSLDAEARRIEEGESAEASSFRAESTQAGMSLPSAGPAIVISASAATRDGIFTHSTTVNAEQPKTDDCEELRENARQTCAGTRECTEAMSCPERKETRIALIKCQSEWNTVGEKCGSASDKTEYDRATGRLRECGRLITQDCCPGWTNDLRVKKRESCNTPGCKGTDDCDILYAKLAAARECVRLRNLETDTCFDGIDEAGHAEQVLENLPGKINRCLEMIGNAPRNLGKTCIPTTSPPK